MVASSTVPIRSTRASRCVEGGDRGFLGLLHMEIIQERLEREYGLDLVVTAPSVEYLVTLKNGEVLEIENPADFPEPINIEKIEEPYVKAEIFLPDEFVGQAMELCQQNRGEFKDMQYIDENRVKLVYEIPLSEFDYRFLR